MSLHGFDGNGQDVRGIGLDRFDGLNNLVARDGLGLDLGLTSDSGISMNVLGLNLAGNDNSEGLTLNDSGTGGDGVDDGDTGGQSDDSVAASAVLAVGDGLGGGEGSGLSSSVCSDGGDRSRSITGDSGTRGGRGVARGSSRSRGITRGSRDITRGSRDITSRRAGSNFILCVHSFQPSLKLGNGVQNTVEVGLKSIRLVLDGLNNGNNSSQLVQKSHDIVDEVRGGISLGNPHHNVSLGSSCGLQLS